MTAREAADGLNGLAAALAPRGRPRVVIAATGGYTPWPAEAPSGRRDAPAPPSWVETVHPGPTPGSSP
ncbi:hypothetical protein [Actinomadura litoris]|uniref:hypothetical protein n=1 Tax=Actinomadura litoris TaxID=2678616 RepID=UPI001FA76ED4|nr:hypothetical protein [Actinomadura litoris]